VRKTWGVPTEGVLGFGTRKTINMVIQERNAGIKEALRKKDTNTARSRKKREMRQEKPGGGKPPRVNKEGRSEGKESLGGGQKPLRGRKRRDLFGKGRGTTRTADSEVGDKKGLQESHGKEIAKGPKSQIQGVRN